MCAKFCRKSTHFFSITKTNILELVASSAFHKSPEKKINLYLYIIGVKNPIQSTQKIVIFMGKKFVYRKNFQKIRKLGIKISQPNYNTINYLPRFIQKYFCNSQNFFGFKSFLYTFAQNLFRYS